MKIPHTKVVHFMTPINPSISSLSVVSLIRTKYKPKLEYNPMYIMAGKVVLKCISPQESKWHNYGVSLCLFKTSKWQALGFLLLSVFISMWQLLHVYSIARILSFISNGFCWNYLSTQSTKDAFKSSHMREECFVENQYIPARLKTLHGKLTHMKHLRYIC